MNVVGRSLPDVVVPVSADYVPEPLSNRSKVRVVVRVTLCTLGLCDVDE